MFGTFYVSQSLYPIGACCGKGNWELNGNVQLWAYECIKHISKKILCFKKKKSGKGRRQRVRDAGQDMCRGRDFPGNAPLNGRGDSGELISR